MVFMKRGISVLFICVSLILLISMPFVSAGWFGDFWGKITGQVVADTCNDQGNNLMVKERCINPLSGGGNTLWDRCSGENVQQVECVAGDVEEVCGYVTAQSCGTGYECSDGACVEISAVCGDGLVSSSEECDDGNIVNGDGCSSTCIIEECSNTCDTLGYECGTHNICGYPMDCGSCNNGFSCNISVCEERACNDSDGGFDYYNEGICTDSTGNFSDIYSGTALVEYYCLNNGCIASAPFVCEQGQGNVCLEEEIGGEDLGIYNGCSELNGQVLDNFVGVGVRITSERIIYYCDPISLEFEITKSDEFSCSENYECLSNDCNSGICVDISEELENQASFLKKIWCGILHPIDASNRNDDGEDQSNNQWWACVIGEDGECSNTCDTLGYECGTQNICGDSVSCGTCGLGEDCIGGFCEFPHLWISSGAELKSCDFSGNCTDHGGQGTSGWSKAIYNNKLWIGGRNGGLRSCDPSGNCTDHGIKAGNIINSMAVYNNKLWMGDGAGRLRSCDSSGNCVGEGNHGENIMSMIIYNNKLWLGQSTFGSLGHGRLKSCDPSGNCTDHEDQGR